MKRTPKKSLSLFLALSLLLGPSTPFADLPGLVQDWALPTSNAP